MVIAIQVPIWKQLSYLALQHFEELDVWQHRYENRETCASTHPGVRIVPGDCCFQQLLSRFPFLSEMLFNNYKFALNEIARSRNVYGVLKDPTIF